MAAHPTTVGQEVPFWPDDLSVEYGREVPIMYRGGREVLAEWPQGGPEQQEVFNQLSEARRSWFRTFDDKIFVLAANYSFDVFVNEDGGFKMWIGRIRYATNVDRERMLKDGVQIRHHGIKIVTPQEMGVRERESSFYSEGTYVSEILAIIGRSSGVLGGKQGKAADERPRTSESENDALESLQTFVDAEFEIEEREAQQEPGFDYSNLRAAARRGGYRQYYDLELNADDYERILEKKPSMLAPSTQMGIPSDVRFEVTRLEQVATKPIIRINVERQTERFDIPQEGRLLLSVIPTTKNVRTAVINALRDGDSANPWLLRLMADEFQAPNYAPVQVELPPSEFPPTASQLTAIQAGAGTPDYALVLGPPGTGKTTVILSWVKHFVGLGMRVLVTSQNNKAVDNVLERLVEDESLECIRIGNEDRVSSSLEPVLLDNKARELQNAMFSEIKGTIEYFDRAISFMNRIESNIDEISQSKLYWQSVENTLLSSQREIDAASAQLRDLGQQKSLTEEEYAEAHRQLYELENGKKSIISGLLNIFRVPRARKRVERSQAELSDIHQQTEYAANLSEQHWNRLRVAKSELGPAEERLRAWFADSPEDYMEDIRLPDFRSVDRAAVAKLRENLSQLRQDADEWHEKLTSERQRALYPMLLEGVDVVGATCIGINTRTLFRDMKFDVVIVDESGQIQAHNLAVPLSRAPKAILVGDHKQLPPVVKDEVSEEIRERIPEDNLALYQQSWFETLWDRTPPDRKFMLNEQFRCPTVISDYISKAFYDGQYRAGAGMDKKKSLLSFCPGPLVLIDTQRVSRNQEVSHNDGTRLIVQDNPVETRIVVELLNRVVSERPELVREREIGVIVPYRNHMTKIHQAIQVEQRRGRLKELDMPLQELVASIDSFQGQERDLIILLFTRSNDRGNVGFLRDWRRLNVALTRAKGQAIAVGDMSTLASRPRSRSSEFKNAMALLGEHCAAHGSLLDGRDFYRSANRRSRRR